MRLGMHHTLTTAALQSGHAASKLASLTPSALTSEQLPVISWHSWNASGCVPLTALQPACVQRGDPPHHQPQSCFQAHHAGPIVFSGSMAGMTLCIPMQRSCG